MIDKNLALAYNFLIGLIKYKERVLERLKEKVEWKLRIPLQDLKGKFLEWVNEEEFLKRGKELLETKAVVGLHCTKLPNQLVVELDLEDREKALEWYGKLFEWLEKVKKWKYLPIFSGNKSIHIHLFFNPSGLTIQDLRNYKEYMANSLAKILPGFDIHITKDTTPFRLPGSWHHKSYKYAELVYCEFTSGIIKKEPEWFSSEEFVNYLISLENKIGSLPSSKKTVKEKENYSEWRLRKMHIKRKGKLFDVYNELLKTEVSDGRDRILMILFTIANTLDIPPERFSEDLTKWANLCDWKGYRWRNWIDYYKEKRYPWRNNWVWAIKEFLNAKDMEKKEWEKVYKILKKHLPFIEKWKE